MASCNQLLPAEELDEAQAEKLADALRSGVAPTGEGTGAGGRAWAAFFDIRDAKGALGQLSVSSVVARAKVARPPFATRGGRFPLLRQAIRDAVLEERADAASRALPSSSHAVVPYDDAKTNRRESYESLRRRLQVADSLNAAYLARALESERKAGTEKSKSKRFLDELNDRDRAEEASA